MNNLLNFINSNLRGKLQNKNGFVLTYEKRSIAYHCKVFFQGGMSKEIIFTKDLFLDYLHKNGYYTL